MTTPQVGLEPVTLHTNVTSEPRAEEAVEPATAIAEDVVAKEEVVARVEPPVEHSPPPADQYLCDLQEKSVDFWEYKPNWGFNKSGFIGLRDETDPACRIVLGGARNRLTESSAIPSLREFRA